MQNVKTILDGLLQQSNGQDAWKLNLIKNWPTVIGSLHTKISLQKITATTVVIGVYDSCWIQELYLLSKLILKKINSSLDKPRIETLRFQCIEKKEIKKIAIKIDTPTKKRDLYPLETKALQAIKDPALSDALVNFLTKCLQ